MQSRTYPDEGKVTGYRCPSCGSSDITCTGAVFEFTTLQCGKCGFSESMDDLQIAAWFAPEN